MRNIGRVHLKYPLSGTYHPNLEFKYPLFLNHCMPHHSGLAIWIGDLRCSFGSDSAHEIQSEKAGIFLGSVISFPQPPARHIPSYSPPSTTYYHRHDLFLIFLHNSLSSLSPPEQKTLPYPKTSISWIISTCIYHTVYKLSSNYQTLRQGSHDCMQPIAIGYCNWRKEYERVIFVAHDVGSWCIRFLVDVVEAPPKPPAPTPFPSLITWLLCFSL